MIEFDEVLKKINDLPEYIIDIGVISEKKSRKKISAKIDLNNAEILFINENGSPLRNIPSRPVLQKTIDWANKELLKSTTKEAINKYLESNFDKTAIEKELNKMCMRMENYARELIYSNSGEFVSNAPSTIKRKGFDHPLFETGQLARSITCRIRSI